jgi:prepilin-type N-terminal cleavage/methylation domain-containing protein
MEPIMRAWRRAGSAAGFTLIELLIAIAIASLVATAILQIFQGSMTQVSQATSLEDAQSTVRIGLDEIVTEFRLIGAYWNGISGAGNAITAATPSSITFMADIDADTVSTGSGCPCETTLTLASAATTLTVSANATAFNTYSTASLNDYAYVANGSAREVRQVAAVAGSAVTLASALTYSYPIGSIVRSVEKVTYTFDSSAKTLTRTVGGAAADTVLDNVTALTFSYRDSFGGALSATPPDTRLIKEIKISMTTQGTGGALRTMQSRVRPRN